MRERYFDNAATTPLDPRVLEEMLPFLTDEFGNANSIHGFGMRAMAAVDLARARVAELIGAEDPSQITFTSGATEANNWAISRGEGGGGRAEGWMSPFEHSAVREPALVAGFSILPNDGLTILPPPSDLSSPTLLSVMSVNNEIGARWDVREFAGPGVTLHSDITQQVGKLPTDVSGLDFASFSAHKFYGPKGIGALYSADEPPEPFLLGGEQENDRRAGTLNVAGIVGMGAAAAIAQQELTRDEAHARELRSIVLEELANSSDMHLNGGENASPYILNLSFRGLEGETLVIEADRAGYAISAGAACSSRSTEPNHVLEALGLEPEWARGTIRVSFGKFNTAESAKGLGELLANTVQRLRKRSA